MPRKKKQTVKQSRMVTIVDPPSGWRYGFPAELQDDYRQQLKEAGYPETQIEFALKHSRYWMETVDES